MSETVETQRTLTVDDIDRFLESPAEVETAQASLPEESDAIPYLDAAAVLEAFDPFRLRPAPGDPDRKTPEGVVDLLLSLSEPIVDGPQRGLWTLSFSERRAALRRLGSREAIRQALAANPKPHDTPVQRMFERVLEAKPILLSDLSRDELAGLITALDWLEGSSLSGLPAAATVRSLLARADLLAPMRRLAGCDFVGRERELEQLQDYVFDGPVPDAPLFVFGAGGVGKSTLLAYFILHTLEPENVPFVYIDLDRPTVRPDRPLTLLLESLTQLQSQLELPLRAIDPLVKEITYSMAREEKGRQLESVGDDFIQRMPLALSNAANGLPNRIAFFVDTFEEAQFLGWDVVWQLLDFLFSLAASNPAHRLVVSGRALPEEFIARAFANLTRDPSSAGPAIERIPLPERPIDLSVLDEASARELLQRAVRLAGAPPLDHDDLDAVISVVGRNPMCLKLAARLLRDEGVEKLREARSEMLVKLRAEKIQALLYGRILSHVHDEHVRRIAYPGLVVRRITPDVIRDVLAGPCRLELDAQRDEYRIFQDLAKEAALVEQDPTDGSLRHRVDVRRAMLADLTDDVEPEVIEQIDSAAVAFYEGKAGAAARAEEIYHRLRLREPAAILDDRWSAEAGVHLKGAGSELPARQQLWLAEKLGITLDDSVRKTAGQEDWEAQTYRSADRFLHSGAPEKALSVLRERSARLPRSPLYLLESEALRFLGEFDEALQIARSGVEAASHAGAIDMALDLLLKMVVIEETRVRLDEADRLLDEAEIVAAHSHNEILRLRMRITKIRVQRQLRPEAREERAALRREVTAILTDEMLHKLRSHPVLLREVAAELGKEDPRIAAAAIETLGIEVTTDDQARALGRAITTLNRTHTSERDADSGLSRVVGRIEKAQFDPEVVRRVVVQELTSTDTKNLGGRLAAAKPGTPVLSDFRKYFRAGVESAMTRSIKEEIL